VFFSSSSRDEGPSVQIASQLRGLQFTSNSKLSMDTHQQPHQQLLEPQHSPQQMLEQSIITHQPISIQQQSIITQPSPVINSISSLTEQQYPLAINTSIPSHYPIVITEEPNYHNTIGNNSMKPSTSESPLIDDENQFTTILPSLHPIHMTSYDQMISRYTGGVASGYSSYNSGDLPPFSPDIPDQYHHHHNGMTITTAYDDEMVTHGGGALASPSISTTAHIQHSLSEAAIISTSTATKVSKKSSTVSTTSASSEYRCDICDKVFNKSCYLTQHNKTFHSGEKPFKCSRCGKRFPCDASHEEHVAKHTGAKPFKCVQCPKAFNHKTDLRRHMCLHSGSKPYTCSTCGKGFIRKDHMVKHTDTHTKKKGNNNKKLKNGKKRLSSLSILPDSNDSMQFPASD
jgi:DNA-directed RNA polymerase subunit RPC12/RpoP